MGLAGGGRRLPDAVGEAPVEWSVLAEAVPPAGGIRPRGVAHRSLMANKLAFSRLAIRAPRTGNRNCFSQDRPLPRQTPAGSRHGRCGEDTRTRRVLRRPFHRHAAPARTGARPAAWSASSLAFPRTRRGHARTQDLTSSRDTLHGPVRQQVAGQVIERPTAPAVLAKSRTNGRRWHSPRTRSRQTKMLWPQAAVTFVSTAVVFTSAAP